MKKFLFISIFFIIFSFTFAQTATVDVNVLRQVVDILQNLIQKGQVQVSTTTIPLEVPHHEIKVPEEKKLESTPGLSVPPEIKIVQPEIKVIQPEVIKLPIGVKPVLPEDIKTKPITPEVIKPILPDEDRSDDAIVQLNNLRITRILLDPGVENVKAIFFAVRDVGWKCLFFDSEKSKRSLPCALELRKPILQKELAIQITDNTILLQRNRQKAKLEDFKVGDKINVYGFMDKNNHGIDALIVRKIASAPKLISPKPTPPKEVEPKLPRLPSTPIVCIQVITPAYNPQNPSECKEFPTPCDVPPNWVKTARCPIKAPSLQIPTTQILTLPEFKVEADDNGFYPAVIEVPKGAKVRLHLLVKAENVYYGGLDFRSEKFKTDPVKPGQKTEIEFTADKNFVIESYWPLSNVKKAQLKVVVK